MVSFEEKLKLKLMASGIDISSKAKNKLTEGGKIPLSILDAPTTSGIYLQFKGKDIFVNTPYRLRELKDEKPFLDLVNNNYIIREGEKETIVEPICPDIELLGINNKGIAFSEIVMIQLDRIRINPISGCAYNCKFCELNPKQYKKHELNEIFEATDLALRAKENSTIPVRHILIGAGTPIKPDRAHQDLVIRKVIEKYGDYLSIDLMVAPFFDNSYLRTLKDYGVREISLNLEVFNKKIAQKIMPQKFALGQDRYLKSLEEAVGYFGYGNVRSMLVVGLEPIESTLEGVKELARRNVLPVLSPFTTMEGIQMENYPTPSLETLLEVYKRSQEIVSKYKTHLGPKCIPCQNNVITFPDNSNFYKYA